MNLIKVNADGGTLMDNNSENNVADKKEAEDIIVHDESDNNSDSNLEEMNNSQDVNNSLLVNRRKLKQRVGTAGIIIMFLLIAASCIVYYVSTRKNNEHAQEEAGKPGRMERTAESGMISASGTTAVGVDAVTYELELEDTGLVVDEVYIDSGDEVEAGEKYLKFTEDSVDAVRNELKSAALNAQLAYRSGVITDNESRIQAKYTYEESVLASEQAEEVYQDTLASLEAELTAAEKKYNEATQDYQELYDAITNNTFYEDYGVEAKKQAYQEAHELYVDRVAYWEVTEEELKKSTTTTDTTTNSANTVNSTNTSNNAAAPSGNAPQSSESGDNSNQNSNNSDGQQPANGAAPGNNKNNEEQIAKKDREWILKTVKLLQEEEEEAEEAYEKAQEDYEDAVQNAELNLKQLQNAMETAREDYEDAVIKQQKESLSAKTTYETALAKGNTAKSDYDTQLESLDETLDKLKDAKEDAENNLALFEEKAGDGYLYTEEAGTIMMSRVEAGQELADGDVLFAYSNPEKISVSVSVSQDDIAQLYVGEKASVMVSDKGNYTGKIETIDPVSASNGKTSVSYTVQVSLEGDVNELEANLTATVLFGDETPDIQTKGDKNKDQEDSTDEQ